MYYSVYYRSLFFCEHARRRRRGKRRRRRRWRKRWRRRRSVIRLLSPFLPSPHRHVGIWLGGQNEEVGWMSVRRTYILHIGSCLKFAGISTHPPPQSTPPKSSFYVLIIQRTAYVRGWIMQNLCVELPAWCRVKFKKKCNGDWSCQLFSTAWRRRKRKRMFFQLGMKEVSHLLGGGGLTRQEGETSGTKAAQRRVPGRALARQWKN